MSRFDKYDPFSGGFRGTLNAAITSADVGKIFAVGINGSNRVIRTGIAATADIVGVICAVRPMTAGEPIDVMTAGEIVEATETVNAVAFTDGAKVYGHTDGNVDDTATTSKYIGQIVESPAGAAGKRLVVRVPLGPAAGLTA